MYYNIEFLACYWKSVPLLCVVKVELFGVHFAQDEQQRNAVLADMLSAGYDCQGL